MHAYRSHHCAQLRTSDINTVVKLSGWVHRVRDHGLLLFIDLRDHYGITQCVVEGEALLAQAVELKNETVVTLEGKVVARSGDTVNTTLPTGEIEVVISSIHVESVADPLPLQVNADREFPEETRLRYRFLDLRREKLHRNIILRSRVIASLRHRMQDQGFLEFQTPILTSSSPEGARDFLVPSRLHPGHFYALPQAPQQFKQLLMASGFDRYFQIAPCFRDEDARADRSPGEFYQLDLEMAFVTQEDVFAAVEPVLHGVFKEFSSKTITDYPFPRITYQEAMLTYGCDKPDLRNPIKLCDVTEIFKDSDFTIFKNNIEKGCVVRAIPAPKVADRPRSFFDKMIEFAQSQGAQGLGYIIFGEDGLAKGPIAKFLNEAKLQELQSSAKLNKGDAVFFSCDLEKEACSLASKVRIHLGNELDLLEKDVFRFCWIIDFPMYEWNEDEHRIDFSHNPFSMPQGGLEVIEQSATKEALLAIRAYQYDIVCNGIELSSGAIRNHKPDLMYKVFEKVGYSKEKVDERFGAMIRAFKFGTPPHGGIAPGVDRMVMLLADEPNIREVICFPMNGQAQDLLMQAPAPAEPKHLQELHLQLGLTAREYIEEQKQKAEARRAKEGQNLSEDAA